MVRTTKSAKRTKGARVKTGWANKSTVVPGLRYLVSGIDRAGKSRTQRAHSVSAARTSRAAKSLVSGSIVDTIRNVVMVTISTGRSKRTGAKKPWNRANLR